MKRKMSLVAFLCVAAMFMSILPFTRQASAAVPSPWSQQDIGSVGLAGSGNYSSGTFTLQGSGTDIAGTADQFHYVYQSLNGDGTIVARVASISNTGSWAKGGVMIRESLTTGSKHVSTVIEYASTSGAQQIRRSSTNGSTATTTTMGVAAPYWVKLQRSGNVFTSSISSNGTTWSTVGTTTVTMTANVYIGLLVCAQNNSALNTTVIDNVSLSGAGGTGSSSTAYEAESGTYGGGGQQQNASNASNGEVVGSLNNIGAYSQVGGVDGGAGGNATLVIRFANGYSSARTLSLYVNGVKQQQLTFAVTSGWNSFADTASIAIPLNAGTGNTIRIQRDSGDNPASDIDKYTVTPSTSTPPPPPSSTAYEAESGSYGGGGQQQNATNASNGKVVGNLNNVGAYSQVGGVDGGTGGNAMLVIRFANGYGSAKTLSLYVNGVKQQQLAFAVTGSWNSFADTASIAIPLNAGTGNTIRIQRDSGDDPAADIDKYTVTPSTSTSPSGNRSGLPWKSGMYRVTDDQSNWAAVQSFENWRGRLVDTITNFPYRNNWDTMLKGDFLTGWQGSPWTQVYALPMFPESVGATFSACAAGNYNSYWTTFGQDLVSHGQGDSIIRLGWEFNGNWFNHSVTTSNLNDWKACYRQVALTLRAAAPNLKFDWNVNRGDGLKAAGNADPALAYPGDDVVDYIGVDSYDQWPPVFDDTTWNDIHLNGTYGLQHWADFATAHGKKLSIPEWGLYHGSTPNQGNDNPFYITKMWGFFNSLGSNLAYEGYYDDDQLTLGNLSYGNNNPNSAPVYNSYW